MVVFFFVMIFFSFLLVINNCTNVSKSYFYLVTDLGLVFNSELLLFDRLIRLFLARDLNLEDCPGKAEALATALRTIRIFTSYNVDYKFI